MKKFIYILFSAVIFFGISSNIFAADSFFCNCTGQNEKVQGQICMMFSSSTLVDENCPSKCSKGSGSPEGVLCVDGPGVTTEPSSGTPPTADSAKTVKLSNPLSGNVTDINVIIGNIIKGALGVMGALVLLMIVWGGFVWLTAAGNPEKVKSGSNTIIWAVLGAIVVLGSYFLLTTVLKALAG